MLSVTQQTKVLEDSEGLCHPVRKSHRFKLIGEHHVAIFVYDLVDDQHASDQLAQFCRRGGRHHGRPTVDSCSLKHKRGAYFTAHGRRSISQGREEGAQNETTYICEWSAVNGGEVRGEGDKSLEHLELYVNTLRHPAVHSLDDRRGSQRGKRRARR